MKHPTMKLALNSRCTQLFRVMAVFTFLPLHSVAQTSEGNLADDYEVLTMLMPERIVLPIGDKGQKLEVSVFAPHNYKPEETYPLLVVLDADPLLGLLKTINFLWTEEGKAASVILVGLPFGASPGAIWANRTYYLLPRQVGVIDYYGNALPLHTGGGAHDLAHFIHDEVLPSVSAKYSVAPGRIGLAGFSLGGLFAAWHLVTYPDVFNDYLVIAPPLAAPFIDAEFERQTKDVQQRGFGRPTRLYFAHSEDDLGYVLTGASSWLPGWQNLDGANLTLDSDVIPDHRHDAGAIPALMNGYEFLYGR